MGDQRVSSKQSNFFFGLNRNKPKLNLFRSFFGLFRETQKKIFSVCFGVSDRYRNNQNKQNFVETNRNKPKKFPKNIIYYRVRETVNFFSRLEPKQTETQSVSDVFRFAFSRNQQIFFRFVSVCFDVSDRYQNNRNKQKL
jgi:hypothetical protein